MDWDSQAVESASERVGLEAVELRYGAGAPVLHGLSFALAGGGLAWLHGPSGAGKTSLLRLIALAVRPTAGRLRVLGQPVAAAHRRDLPTLRRRIGVVFQEPWLLPTLSVFDNVALPLRLARRPRAQIQDETSEMLRWAGLAGHAQARPDALSGGERQLAAVARAVIARPALLLADEPTAALDTAQSGRVLALLAELGRLGTTVLVATRDRALTAAYPGTVWQLANGALRD